MKKLFFENLGLKIASVLLAIVLWIFVTSRGQSEMSIDVPPEFKNIPEGIELVSYNVKTVSLNIKGQERFIKNIKPSDIRISLDLGKAKKGEGIYYIAREDVKLPRSITVTNITPTSVKAITEETMSKTVKVVPVLTGEIARGYYVKSVEAAPQYILIEGIRSEVVKIGTLKTEPFDITGFNESIDQELKLDLTGKNIRAKLNEVNVKIVIGARGR